MTSARVNPTHPALTSSKSLGYSIFVPFPTHPPLGGVAIMYNHNWTVNSTLTRYTRSQDNNVERLTCVLDHSLNVSLRLCLTAVYVPPSSTTQQFEAFWTETYKEITMLSENHDLSPIILTDANAHCITGFDKFRALKIPDRDAPYRHRHSLNKRTLRTPAAQRGSCLEK